ncbi:unnamed protein product [Oikopleura dioica]|uniref:Uncharacterized protein n=1 Tax=Oikopleura dioica TaxID=34765 RepID=E4WU18_OIKDI|nr:unnamed protein product [Oikopleura dioica]
MSAELNIFLNLDREQLGEINKEYSLALAPSFSSDESGLGISSESQSEETDSSAEEQMENPPSFASLTNPRLDEDLSRISDDIDSILASYDQSNLAVQVHTTFQAVRRQRPAREVRAEKINFCHSHVHPGFAIYRQECSRTPSPTDHFTDSIHPMLFFDNTRRLLQRSNDRYARYRQSLNESIQVRTLELKHNNDEALFENSFDEDLELSEFSSDEDELGDCGYEIVDDLLQSSDEESSESSILDSEEDDTLFGAEELKSESNDPEPSIREDPLKVNLYINSSVETDDEISDEEIFSENLLSLESLPQKSPPMKRFELPPPVSKPLYTPVVGYGPCSFVPYGSMLSLNSLILENTKKNKKKRCKAVKNFFKFMFGCLIPDVKD